MNCKVFFISRYVKLNQGKMLYLSSCLWFAGVRISFCLGWNLTEADYYPGAVTLSQEEMGYYLNSPILESSCVKWEAEQPSHETVHRFKKIIPKWLEHTQQQLTCTECFLWFCLVSAQILGDIAKFCTRNFFFFWAIPLLGIYIQNIGMLW